MTRTASSNTLLLSAAAALTLGGAMLLASACGTSTLGSGTGAGGNGNGGGGVGVGGEGTMGGGVAGGAVATHSNGTPCGCPGNIPASTDSCCDGQTCNYPWPICGTETTLPWQCKGGVWQAPAQSDLYPSCPWKPSTCTTDQSCNSDPAMNALAGSCVNGACVCNTGYAVQPTSGKCGGSTCDAQSASTLAGVTIEFDSQPCSFTLAQAKAGITFPYRVIVSQDTTAIVTPLDAGGCGRQGPSGLIVQERIVEGTQTYCPGCDVGECFASSQTTTTLKKGVYTGSFTWDGRSWMGPSDTMNPEGAAFTSGAGTVSLTAKGTVSGQPYSVSATLAITLTP